MKQSRSRFFSALSSASALSPASLCTNIGAAFMILIGCPSASFSQQDSNDLLGTVAQLQIQVNHMKADMEQMKEAMKMMGKTLRRIETSTTARVSKVSFDSDTSSEDNYTLGSEKAPVTIMEWIDFNCPFCAQYHKTTFPELKKKYIDTGKVRYIFRDLVLIKHPKAAGGASFASCAGLQGKYLDALDLMYSNPDVVDDGTYQRLIPAMKGLDVTKFNDCLQSEKYRNQFRGDVILPSKESLKDIDEAEKLGIKGTPAFFIYKTTKVGGELFGTLIRGNEELSVFKRTIDEYLAEQHG